MDFLTITILILAILALGGWGYGAYAVRPAPGTVVETAPGPSPAITFLGVIGFVLLIAFIVMLATGWRFGLQIAPPG
jgi:hypothetical protein